MSYRLGELRPEYEQMFAEIKIRSNWIGRIQSTCTRIQEGRERYEQIAKAVNPLMPWYFPGIIHSLESSFAEAHLHNGDSLKSRTVRVPAGRPTAPPNNGISYSFEESAVDALMMQNHQKAQQWDIAAQLWRLELYNGFGYRTKKIFTPYLWSSTNWYQQGKFVADGRFDQHACSEQVGAAAVIWWLLKEAPEETSPQKFDSNASIQLTQAAQYFQDLPHQTAALQWLQSQTNSEILEEFAKRWRDAPIRPLSIFTPPSDLPKLAVFEMKLGRSPQLLLGNLTFYNESGQQLLRVVVTSGASGYQSASNFSSRGRGPCPPAKNLQISTNGIYIPKKGVEGMFYPILPFLMREYGRSDIGLHFDGNVPGSAGCIVVQNRHSFDSLVVPLLNKAKSAGIDTIPLEIKYS
ncbi:MAG: hypothetical protein KME06_09605 [Kastovskya adunca ATA6-11-RM4]|jgi:lysozyme family protein|nr:hypothetical protein [Kastovskya adunca ATA6-11-RM4]